MTVNELLAELRKLQREGRGEQTVFLYAKGDNWCPYVETVKTYQHGNSGHVVIGSGERPEELKR